MYIYLKFRYISILTNLLRTDIAKRLLKVKNLIKCI